MRADIFALATACLMALAPIAAAQTTTAESTPVVIHAGAAGGEGVIDARAQARLVGHDALGDGRRSARC